MGAERVDRTSRGNGFTQSALVLAVVAACLTLPCRATAGLTATLVAESARVVFAAATGGDCQGGAGNVPPCPDGEDDVSGLLGNEVDESLSCGPAFHVNIATGNVWTEVPIFNSYRDGEEAFSLVFTYNSLLSTPDYTHSGCTEVPGCRIALGWSNTFDVRYFDLDPETMPGSCQGGSTPGVCGTCPSGQSPCNWPQACPCPGGCLLPGDPQTCELRPRRIVIIDGDGRQNVYTLRGGAVMAPPPGNRKPTLFLIPQPNPELFYLVHPNGDRWYFKSTGQFQGRLSRIVTAKGTTRNFEFDEQSNPCRLVEVNDNHGMTATFDYDGLGRLWKVHHPDGPNVVTEFIYDGNTCDLLIIRDPEGKETSFVYETPTQAPPPVDIEINPPLDGSNPVPRTYNMRRIVQETLKNGVVYKCDYADVAGQNARRLTVCKPDASCSIDEPVLEVRSSMFPRHQRERPVADEVTLIDGRNKTWTYVRNGWGQIEQRFGPSSQYQTQLTYYLPHANDPTANFELYGQIDSYTNPMGLRRDYKWKSGGRLSELRAHETITPNSGVCGTQPFDYTTFYKYADDANAFDAGETPPAYYQQLTGLPIKKIQPDGGVWSYRYDAGGRPTLIRDPLLHSTPLTYDPPDPALPLHTKTMMDRRGYKTLWTYYLPTDTGPGQVAGNVRYQDVFLDPGAGANVFKRTEFEYDLAGRKIKETVHRDASTTIATKYEYDKMGRLRKEIKNFNNGIHEQNEAKDQDLITEYDYDGHGQLTLAINPAGTRTKYEYNYRNQLETVIEDEGVGRKNLTTTYERDGNDNPLSVTDALGRVTTFNEYDPLDKVLRMTDAEHYITKYLRDQGGNIEKILRARDRDTIPNESTGLVETRGHDAMGRVTFRQVNGQLPVCYDYNHLPGSSGCGCGGLGSTIPFKVFEDANSDAVTYNHVDLLGRLHKSVRKEGTGPLTGPDTEDNDGDDAQTTYEYDNEGNLIALLGPEGEFSEFIYDGAGRRTSQTVFTGSGQDLVTIYGYDGMDNVTSVTKLNGHMTEYEYDRANRLSEIFDDLGTVVAHTHDENGNVLTRTNGENATWTYRYDDLDRLTQLEDPIVEPGTDHVTKYDYDDAGNVRDVTSYYGQNDSKNVITHYAYDDIDRLTMVVEDYVEELFQGPCTPSSSTSGGGGHNPEVVDPEDPEDPPTSQPTSQPNTVVSYDPYTTDNTTTTYEYDGRFLKRIYDPDCNVTKYGYDLATGLLETIEYPASSLLVTFEHTLSTREVRRADQRGIETFYVFDKNHRLAERRYVKTSAPAAQRKEYFAYDRSGRLTEAFTNLDGDAAGQAGSELVWSRSYDLAARPILESQSYLSGPAATFATEITYALDTNAHTLTQELCYPSCGTRMVNRVWDSRGRLASANAGVGVGVDWSYDDADRRQFSTRRHANQKTTTYSYDAADRMTNIAHYAGPGPQGQGGDAIVPKLAMYYGYNPEGNRKYTEHSVMGLENRSEAYLHDRRNRLTSMNRGTLTFDGSGTPTVQDGNFFANPDPTAKSKLKQKEDWIKLDRRGNWGEFGDSYDGAERIEKRFADDANAYFDIHPNTTSEQQTPCPDVNACPSPTYDNAGNLRYEPFGRVAGFAPNECTSPAVCGPGVEFDYGFENRVTKILRDTNNRPGGHLTNPNPNIPETNPVLEFVYDALGRRVESKEYVDAATGANMSGLSGNPPPRTTRHVFFGLETIQEYVCTSSWTLPCTENFLPAREFVWGDPERYPEVVAMIRHDTDPVTISSYHYLHDVLGSVIGLVNDAGTLVERYTYDPYGKAFIEKWDTNAGGGSGGWVVSAEPISGLPYSAYGNPWMWTGHRYDAAVGLYHFLFRTYSPTLGRWLQRDPIEYEGGSINLYEYVASDPLMWTDQLGLEPYPGGKKTPIDDLFEPKWRPRPPPPSTQPSSKCSPEDLRGCPALIKCLDDAKKEHDKEVGKAMSKLANCGGQTAGHALQRGVLDPRLPHPRHTLHDFKALADAAKCAAEFAEDLFYEGFANDARKNKCRHAHPKCSPKY